VGTLKRAALERLKEIGAEGDWSVEMMLRNIKTKLGVEAESLAKINPSTLPEWDQAIADWTVPPESTEVF